mmetsp:Transcript_74152/g.211679  ORF Transcript_74152/g.211679 Transcript_74152/m.211679 type:complete len:212 (-) Transcript_74152:258-893(-)
MPLLRDDAADGGRGPPRDAPPGWLLVHAPTARSRTRLHGRVHGPHRSGNVPLHDLPRLRHREQDPQGRPGTPASKWEPRLVRGRFICPGHDDRWHTDALFHDGIHVGVAEARVVAARVGAGGGPRRRGRGRAGKGGVQCRALHLLGGLHVQSLARHARGEPAGPFWHGAEQRASADGIPRSRLPACRGDGADRHGRHRALFSSLQGLWADL